MQQSLRDFLEYRARELEKLREPLLVKMNELRAALTEIDKERKEVSIALNAIDLKERHPQMVIDAVDDVMKSISNPDMTIKEAVLATLSKYHGGLTANTILAEVNLLLGTSYLRTSLSPQLSRLKGDGFIILEGNIWKLAPAKSGDAEKNKGAANG
jgi:hypothetical protein